MSEARPDDDAAIVAAAWPALPAPDAGFAAHRADRDGGHLADLFLAYHAARGHPIAVAAIARLLDELRAPLRRTGATAAAVDELLADLPGDLITARAAAPPRLHGYAGRGPLGGWLRVIAVRALVERRRARGEVPDDDLIDQVAAPAHSAELQLLRRRYASEFRAAFAWAVGSLDPSDRALLRQHHLDGVSLDELARLHGVHRATAARRLAAGRELLAARVRRRLLGELRVSGDTLDSIIRLVHSELALSLERYL